MATDKCACLSLHKSARIIGTVLFLITVGLFVAYLIFIEDLRRIIIQDFFDVSPCSQPWIDILIDSLFEYSLLVNLLLIGTCVGCTRWVLMPWLIVYNINILLLLGISIYQIIYPLPLLDAHTNYNLLRLFGLVPLAVALLLGYFWMVVRNLFFSISALEKKNDTGEDNGCCNLGYKTGVQIMAGVLTIFSAIFLVLHYVKLDEMIEDKFERMFKSEPPQWNLKIVVTIMILTAIAVNLMIFVGSTGDRWRRVFLMPWLIYYGLGILIAIGAHQWLTTLCWVEEKIYGLIALGIGFLTTILWTAVWIVAAEAADKQPQVLLNRNPLGFQRL